MLTRVLAVSAGFVVAAGAASAASVQIDFTSGQNIDGSFDDAGQTASGTWSENGFDLSWDYVDDFGVPNASVASDFDDFTMLSDCGPFGGCGAYGTQMTVTSGSGSPFSLMNIASDVTLEGYVVDAELTFFRPDGTLNFNDKQGFQGTLIRNSLALNGVKSDGSTVSGTARTGDPATESAGFNAFGPGMAQFPGGSSSDFTDLVSLTIGANGADPTVEEQRQTLVENGMLPTDLMYAIEGCGYQSCIIPGLGELTYDLSLVGGRNDTIAVKVAGLELEAMTPAHAPLPASILFLGAGIGLLGLGRVRRRR